MKRKLPYRYTANFNQIKSIFKSVQFITPNNKNDKLAKAVIRSLYNRVNCGKLNVINNYIEISGSDGDKIIHSEFSNRIQLIKKVLPTVDTTNEWWQN